MPVQFHCTQCRRTLSVGQRKVGATVACPKCGAPNTVPRPERSQAAPVAASMTESAPAPTTPGSAAPDSPAIPEAVVFDDIPELIAMIDSMPVASSTASAIPPASEAPAAVAPPAPPVLGEMLLPSVPRRGPSPPVSSARSSGAIRRGRDNDAMLLVSRTAVYAQAALMAVVALAALTAGYLIGRGARSTAPSSDAVAAGEPVALEGHIGYTFATDALEPDAGAVVAVLPAKKQPARKLEASLFSPGAADESKVAAREAVESLGGALATADDDGHFQLVVPRSGDYFLLIVSRHAERQRGQPISPKHLAKLSAYFDAPADLIDDKRYAWLSRRLAGAPPPVRHEFREE